MPKGFNAKAIEGFTQWMTAVMNNTSLEDNEIKDSVETTKHLLEKGFPQVRKY